MAPLFQQLISEKVTLGFTPAKESVRKKRKRETRGFNAEKHGSTRTVV